MKLLNLFKRNNSSKVLGEKVSTKAISGAYETRKKEIESLRKYDRGEKEIIAPRLETLSKGV